MNARDYERARSALAFIPPDDRDIWVSMGMALKDGFGDEGFDLWDAWSRQSDRYNERDARDVWRSLKAGGGITLGTLFHEAKARGWRDDGTYRRPTQEEVEERRRQNAERAAKEEREERFRHEAAAEKAAENERRRNHRSGARCLRADQGGRFRPGADRAAAVATCPSWTRSRPTSPRSGRSDDGSPRYNHAMCRLDGELRCCRSTSV